MINKVIKVVVVAIGIYALIEAGRWMVHPEIIAGTLGLELPSGQGASSMISYFAALPFLAGLFSILGVGKGRSYFLYTPLAMFSSVMCFRILAGVFGYAPFSPYIFIGLLLTVIFGFSIYRLSSDPAPDFK